MSKYINVFCSVCNMSLMRQKNSIKLNIERNGQYLCISCSSYKRNSNPEYILKLSTASKKQKRYKGQLNPCFGKKKSVESVEKTKLSLNKITENGKTVAQNGAIKASETMKMKGTYKENSKKSAITKNLNNSWVTYHTGSYLGLYYRSNLELDFIIRCLNNSIKINNCNFTIPYIFNNNIKYYCPDYCYPKSNIIYEIKSEYTLGLTNDELFNLNILKFISSIEKYTLILVLYKNCKNINEDFIKIKKHNYLLPQYFNINSIFKRKDFSNESFKTIVQDSNKNQ